MDIPRPVPRPERSRSSTRLARRREAFPWASILSAGLVSFFFLVAAPPFAMRLLDELIPGIETIGPITLNVFSYSYLVQAVAGSALLSSLALTATMAQARWRLSDEVIFLLAFPAAGILVLPSVLAEPRSWLPWLALGTLAATVFDLHWRVFTWAREMFD